MSKRKSSSGRSSTPRDPSPPSPPDPSPASTGTGGFDPAYLVGAVLLALALMVGYGLFNWFMCRIEVPPGNVAVLIAKTGENLEGGRIAAREQGQKGILLETLKPARHFRNPLFYDWQILPIFRVPPGQVGVLTRLYGDLPDTTQNLLVPLDSHDKGIVAEPLLPGLHEKVNPMLYQLELHPAVEIEPGFVGVVCNRIGNDPETPNTYLVQDGERGVQEEVLRPGLHFLNPYAFTVYRVDVRSQRLELAGDPRNTRESDLVALRFPSSDAFEIEVKLTVEWAIDEARASEVFVRIGVGEEASLIDNILYKTLIPALRGNARIEGSKYQAVDYITGESRTVFQTSIFDSLRETCEKQGILIRSVLVNDILPPQQIAGPIRQREVAREELERNRVQLEQARAEQSLARETELVQQEQARVEAETSQERARITAQNAQEVAMIEQDQLLEVARADREAARLESVAILARGRADADVIIAQNTAQTEALRRSVEAFGDPLGLANYTFAKRVGPTMRRVFADPNGPFGALFRNLLDPAPDRPAPLTPEPPVRVEDHAEPTPPEDVPDSPPDDETPPSDDATDETADETSDEAADDAQGGE